MNALELTFLSRRIVGMPPAQRQADWLQLCRALPLDILEEHTELMHQVIQERAPVVAQPAKTAAGNLKVQL